MFPQYPVRQCSMSQQLYGAVEIAFQPFAGNARIGVVVQCFVDTGYCLHVLQDSADIVAYQDNRPFFIDFFQQRV